jgi:hypothetical protein
MGRGSGMFRMETVAKNKPRHRLRWAGIKAGVVGWWQAGDPTVPQVARDFDLIETSVRTGMNQAEVDATSGTG